MVLSDEEIVDRYGATVGPQLERFPQRVVRASSYAAGSVLLLDERRCSRQHKFSARMRSHAQPHRDCPLAKKGRLWEPRRNCVGNLHPNYGCVVGHSGEGASAGTHFPLLPRLQRILTSAVAARVALFSLRSVGPRPVRLKVECTKPLLDLAGQLL